MNRWLKLVAVFLVALLAAGCSGPFRKPSPEPASLPPAESFTPRLAGDFTKFYRIGDINVKKVALTFDDGPDSEWTPQILNVLRDKQVKATFFLIGREVDKYPDIVRRMAAEGHILGNHTYNHVDLNNLPPEKMVEEITRCNDAIVRVASVQPCLLRPPHGAQNPRVIEVAGQQGFYVILWSVDTEDWRGFDAATVKMRTMRAVKNGYIILQHSGEGPNLSGSVIALPQIIDELHAAGYEIVTVPELLNLPSYK